MKKVKVPSLYFFSFFKVGNNVRRIKAVPLDVWTVTLGDITGHALEDPVQCVVNKQLGCTMVDPTDAAKMQLLDIGAKSRLAWMDSEYYDRPEYYYTLLKIRYSSRFQNELDKISCIHCWSIILRIICILGLMSNFIAEIKSSMSKTFKCLLAF